MKTIRFSPQAGWEAHLRAALAVTAEALAGEDGMCAAHLLIVDRDRSQISTREASLRGRPDAMADWILLVDGYDEAVVARDRSALLGQQGDSAEMLADLYAIEHIVLSHDELV
ncbi:hypothetical protein MAE02_55940 [Microvirga aerophila]|uniref:Uncharacterized protein n=2 Tax=Microvirga aerophila TaxID=670291 RepID=A0A512C112_9HYPH|nr:hypothetical protein MAE02_55940 [Microvirga aerophila]